MLGLDAAAFWLMIGAPAIVIVVMLIACVRIKREDRD